MKVNTSVGTAMAIWVMEFQVQGYKIRKIFVKKSTYRKVASKCTSHLVTCLDL